MKSLFAILLLLSSSAFAFGPSAVVAVGKAELEQEKISFSGVEWSGVPLPEAKELADEIYKIFLNDFSVYTKLFLISDDKSYIQEISGERKDPQMRDWAQRGTNYLVRTLAQKADKATTITVIVYDIKMGFDIFKASKTVSRAMNFRAAAHDLSNGIYKAITRKDSIFTTRVALVCETKSIPGYAIKELFVMDFDGGNFQQLTHHDSVVLSPYISSDKTKILYTLIRPVNKIKRIELYLYDVSTRQSKVISDKPGINSGANFLPGDKEIVFTLSKDGNAEIYKMNLATSALTKITNHYAADVDPSINADGTLMTFLSNRPGKAMIYTMDPRGTEKDVKRISFVGQFNATPRFSPDGKEIVFSSWLDNTFDIFRINSEGQSLVRLTKGMGSNENPSFSNDGQFIVFSSQVVVNSKKATQTVYLMDKDGEILGPIRTPYEKCMAPRLSN
jgi:TolB protein